MFNEQFIQSEFSGFESAFYLAGHRHLYAENSFTCNVLQAAANNKED